MTSFLFVRHGRTEYNEKHLLQGQRDIPLSSSGKQDALIARDALSSFEIDEIYTSPLLRAKETAFIINETRKAPLFTADALKEMNYGTSEGKLTYESGLGIRRDQFFTRFPGGENYFEVACRVYPFLESVEKKHQTENKTVLLVAHMGIYRVIRSYFTDMSNEEFTNCHVRNGEVIILPERG